MMSKFLSASTSRVDLWSLINAGWFALIVGLLTAFAGGVLSVILYYKAKATAELRFATADVVVVGAPDESVSDGLEIRFMDLVVPQVMTTSVALWNAGRVTLRGQEVVASDPLRVEIAGEGQLLRIAVEGVSRDQIGAEVWIDDNRGVIRFDFLDANDALRLRVIHTGERGAVQLRGTIRGLPKGLSEQKPRDPLQWAHWLMLPMFLFLFGFLLYQLVKDWMTWSWANRAWFLLAVPTVPILAWVTRRFDRFSESRSLRGVPEVVTQDDALLGRLKWPLR